MDNHIKFQTASGIYRKVLGKYYNSLKNRDKPFIKKTEDVAFLPYLSTIDQVYDFIFWMDETDPLAVQKKIVKEWKKGDEKIVTAILIALDHAMKYDSK